ncbi:MAG: VWA domain-containing protein [Ferrovibrio sp.]|uniref:vWA domain-containing protein n=1 Tax=Ferrovibrio sp. TaxID=1917215 RepID=UPI0026375D4B|nr:VWA domain-containing protein [Ferrovibrio sp.]MCW0233172.1 VWA domain-containing protein [Ferrovibrio sp.]
MLLPEPPAAVPDGAGAFATNIVHFVRLLRASGLRLGPGKAMDAVRAVEVAGIRRRDDLYWTLFSVLVNRRDQRELFDQAFHIFWRDPKILERMMSLLLPQTDGTAEPRKGGVSQRLREALLPGGGGSRPAQEPKEVEIDATLTFSADELLQKKDFAEMTAEEMEHAKTAMARIAWPFRPMRTRRLRPDARGHRIDLRASLQASLRTGGTIIPLKRRSPGEKPPPLVVLCDISGSMSQYSRMFLHFMHALSNDRSRVHSFLFGTRLTNISRLLRQRDVDKALEAVSEKVPDWSGGTRIGTTLAEFNRLWSRRVLGQGAVVLLLTDGLDREGGEGLPREVERLQKSCRRLIWLNPLLRWDGFEPKAAGIRAILPHVDDFRPVHNLSSIADLANALSQASDEGNRLKLNLGRLAA